MWIKSACSLAIITLILSFTPCTPNNKQMTEQEKYDLFKEQVIDHIASITHEESILKSLSKSCGLGLLSGTLISALEFFLLKAEIPVETNESPYLIPIASLGAGAIVSLVITPIIFIALRLKPYQKKDLYFIQHCANFSEFRDQTPNALVKFFDKMIISDYKETLRSKGELAMHSITKKILRNEYPKICKIVRRYYRKQRLKKATNKKSSNHEKK